jgi:hypothetical protein
MGNKQSNCLVKARAPFDPLLWNSDDVDNIANAYEAALPDGPVNADDMVRVLAELDGAVIFQYGDGRVFGKKEVCERFAALLVEHGDDDNVGTLDHEQFAQTLKLVLVFYQVLASDPQRIADVRENPFNALMMMEQIAIAAAIQEAEEMHEQEEKQTAQPTPDGWKAETTETKEMIDV